MLSGASTIEVGKTQQNDLTVLAAVDDWCFGPILAVIGAVRKTFSYI